VAFRTLAPELEVLAPIETLLEPHRKRAFLSARGFTFPEKIEQYSINEECGYEYWRKGDTRFLAAPADGAYPGGEIDPALQRER